jgi:hypothetical protein
MQTGIAVLVMFNVFRDVVLFDTARSVEEPNL